ATEGDPYLLAGQIEFADRALLDRYLSAVQRVVDRHDILRTGFVWEGLRSPVQVVWRQAGLMVSEVNLDPSGGPCVEQLKQRFDPRDYRIELSEPPLLRFVIARDPHSDRWLVQMLQHHLIGDHSTLEVLQEEVSGVLSGNEDELPLPEAFRNVVAQARMGASQDEHEQYFRSVFNDIQEPVLPFGLDEVHGGGSGIREVRQQVPQEVNERLRAQARRLGVSLATLCHVAWAQVVGQTSASVNAIFGTVLVGRMQAGVGADRAMGVFINTLPLRLDLAGTVEEGVRQAHLRLAELLEHEHASLALAQRCSGVAPGTPLFSALLNYRHNAARPASSSKGIKWLGGEERTNYPVALSVEDFETSMGLTAQVDEAVPAERVCGYMQQALANLADALERTPDLPLRQLDILP
ncbi:condensation domain-containing protein, partial [Agrobacterium tumefaciens]|uniref:condensation domain-containing protein n=1 Tax=Agrobacterium tumefaciens TaxID=358 RepID=UPI001FCDBB0C